MKKTLGSDSWAGLVGSEFGAGGIFAGGKNPTLLISDMDRVGTIPPRPSNLSPRGNEGPQSNFGCTYQRQDLPCSK